MFSCKSPTFSVLWKQVSITVIAATKTRIDTFEMTFVIKEGIKMNVKPKLADYVSIRNSA